MFHPPGLEWAKTHFTVRWKRENMRYQQLGASGLTVSVVGRGCNTFGDTLPADEVTGVVHAAIDRGVTLFDTADVYGSVAGEGERLLGKALEGVRDDVIVATKFGMDTRGANGADRKSTRLNSSHVANSYA